MNNIYQDPNQINNIDAINAEIQAGNQNRENGNPQLASNSFKIFVVSSILINFTLTLGLGCSSVSLVNEYQSKLDSINFQNSGLIQTIQILQENLTNVFKFFPKNTAK